RSLDIEVSPASCRTGDFVLPSSRNSICRTIKMSGYPIKWLYPQASRITLIGDNARYYRARAVTDYLEHSRIRLKFLPPDAPNVHLIERFWQCFKGKLLYDHDYATFAEYKNACRRSFANLGDYAPQLRTLLTENFEIIRIKTEI
ncbi:MAG: transposase, partial [Chromatiaceae bacterium]